MQVSPQQLSDQREVVVVLPDIRSTFNTGSFFRTADAAGVSKLYLTGITATPPHPHLLKVSLGAETVVPWEYISNTLAAIQQLKDQGFQIVVVELTSSSQDFRQTQYGHKVALIFGNENTGVGQSIQDLADLTVFIPMRGHKESLNVAVAGGIIIYHLL